ncbi:Hsp20/alpha crystallin family protein [Rubrobacter marinus]|nr:Hsp20/alpha crystallin family protein [Rubrobacter marinus]
MERARNPFRGLIDHMSEMARMREVVAEGGGQAREDRRRTYATAWVPTTDIFAKGDDLVIRCELAGVRQDDVDITLANGVLSVSGERRSELDDEEPAFYTRERSYGQFRRVINLPDGVDGSKMDARFEDGLLEIKIEGGANLPEPQHVRIRSRDG